MTGVSSRISRSGSRSEILADYLFSSWGTVTPVRWSDDHGVDLYCTLTDDKKKVSIVTGYYSVQVKSNFRSWLFKSAAEIAWLFNYSTPLFLACVDKKKNELSIYQTMSRFLAAFRDPPPRLSLKPSKEEVGKLAEWKDSEKFSLSAPILRVSVGDFSDEKKLATFREVFRHWVQMDNHNCDLSRMGILRFRMPGIYRTNEMPQTGFVEQGEPRPTAQQLKRAIRTLFEVVDCVGVQLNVGGDRRGALLAALLMRYMRKSRSEEFQNDIRWNFGITAPLERDVSAALSNAIHDGDTPASSSEKLEDVISFVENLSDVSTYLKGSSSP